ncbi:Uncharacterised protein [Serratia proteamaculans]|uniref:hypothetical protein n=1 Tax=Serratia proteamaculans TaxID=28151 RepID=UPI0021826745|nr:hypothetical protein [Serratia proteamaculans]CAI2401631.1 Uncharacterised protein [Serratia proteamaculans]
MRTGNYAVIKTGGNKVENIIVADDYFSLDGFDLIPFAVDNLCQIGMFYNEKDDRFYDDESFTKISGVNVESN